MWVANTLSLLFVTIISNGKYIRYVLLLKYHILIYTALWKESISVFCYSFPYRTKCNKWKIVCIILWLICSLSDCVFIFIFAGTVNPLDSKGNYNATLNNMKLVHWVMVGCYIWYSEEGPGRARAPPQSLPRCTKCNSPPINGQCTNHYVAIWWSVALRF